MFPCVACQEGSIQATLGHTHIIAYRCFVPDLTRFTINVLHRTQISTPSQQDRPYKHNPRKSITLAIADCKYRAPLPPRLCDFGISTAKSGLKLWLPYYYTTDSLIYQWDFKKNFKFFYREGKKRQGKRFCLPRVGRYGIIGLRRKIQNSERHILIKMCSLFAILFLSLVLRRCGRAMHF